MSKHLKTCYTLGRQDDRGQCEQAPLESIGCSSLAFRRRSRDRSQKEFYCLNVYFKACVADEGKDLSSSSGVTYT